MAEGKEIPPWTLGMGIPARPVRELTEAGVRQERKRIDARLAQISTELADATQIDLLPELRAPGADPALSQHVGARSAQLAIPGAWLTAARQIIWANSVLPRGWVPLALTR